MLRLKKKQQAVKGYRDGTGWNIGMGMPHNAPAFQEKMMKE